MSLIQAVLNEFMPCGGSVCRGCEVECAHGGHTNGGRTPDVDSIADALIKAREQRDALKTQLAAARVLLKSVPSALNAAFSAGAEEHENGSYRRQEKEMEKVYAMRKAITAALTQGDA